MEWYFSPSSTYSIHVVQTKSYNPLFCIDQEINLVNSNWDYFLKTNRKQMNFIGSNKVCITDEYSLFKCSEPEVFFFCSRLWNVIGIYKISWI